MPTQLQQRSVAQTCCRISFSRRRRITIFLHAKAPNRTVRIVYSWMTSNRRYELPRILRPQNKNPTQLVWHHTQPNSKTPYTVAYHTVTQEEKKDTPLGIPSTSHTRRIISQPLQHNAMVNSLHRFLSFLSLFLVWKYYGTTEYRA